MEIWDTYYEDCTKTGIDLVRGEPVPENLFHAVAEIIVQHQDGEYLLMRRDLQKEGYPGFWELGAGGSVVKGETFLEGAKRELFEECGILAEKLELLQQVVDKNKRTIYCEYLCVCEIEKDAIILQEGETIDYRWVTKEELQRFLDSPDSIATQRDRVMKILFL